MDLCDAHKAWMESPEMLERCSMGFTFPLQSDETPEVWKNQFSIVDVANVDFATGMLHRIV